MSDGPSDYARAEAIESERRDATWPRVPDAGGPGKHAVFQGAASAGVPLTHPADGAGSWITKSDGPKLEVVPGGARRSSKAGKGRFDLLSWHANRRRAGVYERGAVGHGDWNWTKGMPMSGCLSSALRHLEQWKAGEVDEDHLGQAMWNLDVLAHYDEEIRAGRLPAELRDAGPR